MNQKTVLDIIKVVDDKLIYYKNLAESEDTHSKRVGLYGFQAVKSIKLDITKILKKNYDRSKRKRRPSRTSLKSPEKKNSEGKNSDSGKR